MIALTLRYVRVHNFLQEILGDSIRLPLKIKYTFESIKMIII